MLRIENMGLGPMAKLGATILLNEFGDGIIRFTRGYSDLRGQARAMAQNVARNKDWIKETYRRKERPSYGVALQLQEEVYNHPTISDVGAIELYLHDAMLRMPNAGDISFHTKTILGEPAAEAFDLEPIYGTISDQVKNFIWTLPNLDSFVTREGGLEIWHAQFMERVPVTEV